MNEIKNLIAGMLLFGLMTKFAGPAREFFLTYYSGSGDFVLRSAQNIINLSYTVMLFSLNLYLGIWMVLHSRKIGKQSLLWLGMGLIFGILGLLVYLIVNAPDWIPLKSDKIEPEIVGE